ncbi:hypothetical protein ACPWSR_03140 [Alloiococcus sp. CFN-8]|uniref:hypothetical protein n=1 Tax=Alloiococcus sp. CFN-8 TaxID=3416081 RepID=UPI003CF8F43B
MEIARKKNINILFITLSIYAFNRFYLKSIIEIPVLSVILRNHFNDFLAGVAFLAYLNFILSYYKMGKYQVNNFIGAIITAFLCGVFWEFITPLYKVNSTSDWFDILAYILGSSSYIIMTKVLRLWP